MPTVSSRWHAMDSADVCNKLNATEHGLSSAEVEQRRAAYGPNELPREKPLAWWTLLIHQFLSPLILILTVAAAISGLLNEWLDVWVIAAAIGLNTAIGFAQEHKATRALEQLRALVRPHALVRRAEGDREVNASEIVPGDILILSAGDRVPADARILEGTNVETDEAPLTGESLPVNKVVLPLPKDTPLSERRNMFFAGTSVVSGRATAVVVAIGSRTELGAIAELVRATPEGQTPLQEQLRRLAKWISVAAVVIVSLLLAIGLATGREPVEMFEVSVALAVAAVPEGLAVSVTVILAIGMQRILKRKSLVRRLIAAETLGSVSLICVDKTGTITEGRMRVSEVVPQSGPFPLSDIERMKGAESVIELLEIGMLCNDAAVEEGTEFVEAVVHGTPTELALVEAGLQAGISWRELHEEYARYAELPFDSVKKYMATLNAWRKHGRALLVKGAPEKILSFCTTMENGGKKPLTDSHRRRLEQMLAHMTERGLRVIAFAHKAVSKEATAIDPSMFAGLVFIGFIGLRDPLRAEAAEQIRAARTAGIRTVIITGDHPNTAFAIGKQAGVLTSREEIVTGADLDGWDDRELDRRVEAIDIYARVEPRHKIRIVDALQRRGEVVAMTGDGVNDAPALKAADIGIALGSGSEVAKQVADVVLLDNNLGTITAAIEQGRVIFDNIRKTIVYLMADSFTEIVLIAGALVLGLPLPLLPAQILWINLVADSLPNAGLTMEPGEPDVMKAPPRSRREPVLNREMLTFIFLIGLVTDAALFGLYLWFLGSMTDIGTVRSIMFAAVGIDSLFYVFAVKSFRRTIFHINPFSNLWLLGGVTAGFIAMLLAMLVPPLQAVFQVTPLPLSDWLLLLMMGAMKLVAIELGKAWFIFRKRPYAS